MVSKLSSYDLGYIAGDLSIFPEAIDSYETLYFAKNNSETVLTQALNYGSDLIIAEDATAFPDKGVLRINLEDKYATFPEYVYYERKTNQVCCIKFIVLILLKKNMRMMHSLSLQIWQKSVQESSRQVRSTISLSACR